MLVATSLRMIHNRLAHVYSDRSQRGVRYTYVETHCGAWDEASESWDFLRSNDCTLGRTVMALASRHWAA